MAAVGSCRICRKEQGSKPCCRGVFLRRSCRLRLRHRTDGEEDRISAVPDNLLYLFLARLRCARAAAHASLLSRRCRDLWTSVPELTFHNTAPDQIEAALARVTRPSLSLLDIHVSRHHELEPAGVTSLLRSAARLEPVEFKVDFTGVTQSGGNPPHPAEVLLPCFDRTTSISIWMSYPVVPLLVLPLGEDFLKLESLSLRSCEVNIADLLRRCPRLRKLCIQRSILVSITAHSPSLEELDVSTDVVLQRVDIQAPLLKKLSIYADFISNEFTLSYSAPMLVELKWKCGYHFSNVGFGIWRLSSLTLETPKPLGDSQLTNDKESTCLQPQLCPRVDAVSLLIWTFGLTQDVPRSFRQLMSQLLVANFSILELVIITRGHAYGELVVHLLRVSSTAQRLKMKLRDVGLKECSVHCTCDHPNNWRSQTVPMTKLTQVEIQGFKGETQEIDLLKLIFRSATKLEKVTIELYSEVLPSDSRYMETLGILEAHPSVKSTITSTL